MCKITHGVYRCRYLRSLKPWKKKYLLGVFFDEIFKTCEMKLPCMVIKNFKWSLRDL